MAKKTTRNNDFLYTYKDRTSEKIYPLLVKLVNDNREDLAKIVVKIDYLLEYSSTCIKEKDFDEARETLDKVKVRIDALKVDYVDTEYIEHLYEGILKKCK